MKRQGEAQIKMGFTCQVGLGESEHIKPAVLSLHVHSELDGNSGIELNLEPLGLSVDGIFKVK